MITKIGMPFGGLKKAGFTGSEKGMRFFVIASKEEDDKLIAYVYPEPYSFINTPDEKKISKTFDYTHEGVDEILAWLNHMYEEGKDNWDKALATKNNDVRED